MSMFTGKRGMCDRRIFYYRKKINSQNIIKKQWSGNGNDLKVAEVGVIQFWVALNPTTKLFLQHLNVKYVISIRKQLTFICRP